MSHDELCERAKRWLAGTRRCNPVFSNIASCAEIPDAIGWSSDGRWRGSTVVECKTSVSDFYADRKKFISYQDPQFESLYSPRWITKKKAIELGWKEVEIACMGKYRFYLCEAEILSLELIETKAHDHGLLWINGRRIQIVRPAPEREKVDKDAEIRYLRFAIINGKTAYFREPEESKQMELAVEGDF